MSISLIFMIVLLILYKKFNVLKIILFLFLEMVNFCRTLECKRFQNIIDKDPSLGFNTTKFRINKYFQKITYINISKSIENIFLLLYNIWC